MYLECFMKGVGGMEWFFTSAYASRSVSSLNRDVRDFTEDDLSRPVLVQYAEDGRYEVYSNDRRSRNALILRWAFLDSQDTDPSFRPVKATDVGRPVRAYFEGRWCDGVLLAFDSSKRPIVELADRGGIVHAGNAEVLHVVTPCSEPCLMA